MDTQIQEIPVDQCVPNPFQPRQRFKEEELQELADSIKNDGLQQPINVRPFEGGFQILFGERRWRAHKLAGLETIKAIVRQANDREAREIALVENIQRVDLTPLEEAHTFRDLLGLHADDMSEVAKATSKKEEYITDRLALLSLPLAVQNCLNEGTLNLSHARVILDLPEGEQVGAAERAVKFGMSPHELKGSMQRQLKKKAAEGPASGTRAVSFNKLTSLTADLYDGLEGFDFSMLRDEAKCTTLKLQFEQLSQQVGEALVWLGKPAEERTS